MAVAAAAAMLHCAPQIMLAAAMLAVGSAGATAVWSAICLLCSPLLHYPYPTPASRKGTVVYAASFNPPHNGHLDIVRHLAAAHEKVYLAIGVNPKKKYPVDPYIRRDLLKRMVTELALGENVEVTVVTGYIWRFAFRVGATRFYRGIRSWEKDGYEEKNLEMLNLVGPLLIAGRPGIRTAYLEANPRWANISSTHIRNCIRLGQGLDDLVPSGTVRAVEKAYAPALSEPGQ
eukprot:gnl/TRDRNA2_/TRDRNA2_143512_c0_seq1.p1 gnl/TRDRNA2_/TRDRNA2_143512_c0~~gnl/TRDRNA2_/TRDRNA2_143512_c0_seq1.p1  ORF type:complete len:239 (-),score=30.87 gnl/TRDRNA2_/TRDRNA2_143512_c0_seq1:148-843(-)